MDTFRDDVPVDWPPENEKLVVKPIRELVLDSEFCAPPARHGNWWIGS